MLVDYLAAAALRPGLIWGFDFHQGQGAPVDAASLIDHAPQPPGFRWLHFNLADQSTRRWISGAQGLSLLAREILLSADTHQQAVSDGVWTCLVLHDIERDFDETETRVGALRVAVGPSMMITARLHPLRSGDIVRERILKGAAPAEAAEAFELMLDATAEALRSVVGKLDASVQEIEDALLDDGAQLTARTFVTMRALMVRLHRVFTGARAMFKDLDEDGRLPAPLAACLERAGRRLASVDSDLMSIQGQLRLLREELDLQATQRTNQNLYILSMMTALLMPATLVTGLFGMNTKGLPWADSPEGTLIACLLAIGASAAVYLLLRLMGFIRR